MKKQRIVNTIGADAVFTKTGTDTQGDYTEIEAVLPRCSKEELAHIHPLQTIRLEALDGELGIVLPDRRVIIRPGHPFDIPRNVEHSFYNADEKPVRFKSTLQPALHTEWLAKEISAVKQRKPSRFMSVIQHSYIFSRVQGEYFRSDIPVFFQKTLAAIARLTGVHKSVSAVF
ncbi:MAG TPA: cupin domain-containing protein [Chitinophagaceae bacterium]|nr:cupin domain-containing protein [Chitinophagaceae bacterium]